MLIFRYLRLSLGYHSDVHGWLLDESLLATSYPRAWRPFRDLKECDGTHSERCVRRVPTLRNKHEHRIRKAHLWASCALSVAIVCQMFMPLYIIVMPYLRHFGSFVPKVVIEMLKSLPVPFESFHMLYGFVVNSKIGLHKFLRIMRF